MPQCCWTWAITSGLSGSPAPISSRSEPEPPDRSDLMSIRHTVGGAQNVVTLLLAQPARSRDCGSKRA